MLAAYALVLCTALAGSDETPISTHAPLQAVLDQHLSRGRVDYGAIKSSDALDAYLQTLAGASEPTGRAERMAFWINAYNALTIDLIADEWPLASIRDLNGGNPWDARKFTVAGRSVTLNTIEHKILRPMGDPRIHAAVNCASIGCPPLYRKVFTAGGLNGQLAAASRSWASSNGAVINQAAGTVQLSQIFDWYGDDFVRRADTDVPGIDGKQEAAVDFLADHLDAEVAGWLRSGGYTIGWSDYSWKVNSK
jgi:hypothetical protein